ncbi:hypothetical protein SCA6_020276 [Theobroma cacao]
MTVQFCQESIADAKRKKRVKVAALITMSIVLGMLLGVLVWRIYLTRKAKIRRAAISENNSYRDTNDETQEGDLELPLFGLDVVSAATNKFSFEKKIGEGGFGPVYKGVLPTGQEVAVKRLSQNSGQGLREFKNETWKLWNEGNPLELMDELMEDTISENEVVRCIQVGLLCVQQRMEDRPTMSSVLLMLSNESIMVPQPKEPGFCTEISSGGDTSSSVNNLHTANELTVTDLGGR